MFKSDKIKILVPVQGKGGFNVVHGLMDSDFLHIICQGFKELGWNLVYPILLIFFSFFEEIVEGITIIRFLLSVSRL